MLILSFIEILISVAGCTGNILNQLIATVDGEEKAGKLPNIDDLDGMAQVDGAGAHRGPQWYDYQTSASSAESQMKQGDSQSMSLSTSNTDRSSGASTFETKEKRLQHRVYRTCTPCPLDMLKKYRNIGIAWICGAYQRARRSFKSECMMRYRNCQDGTMFVKVADHRCSDDLIDYHGRSFFYEYKT